MFVCGTGEVLSSFRQQTDGTVVQTPVVFEGKVSAKLFRGVMRLFRDIDLAETSAGSLESTCRPNVSIVLLI